MRPARRIVPRALPTLAAATLLALAGALVLQALQGDARAARLTPTTASPPAGLARHRLTVVSHPACASLRIVRESAPHRGASRRTRTPFSGELRTGRLRLVLTCPGRRPLPAQVVLDRDRWLDLWLQPPQSAKPTKCPDPLRSPGVSCEPKPHGSTVGPEGVPIARPAVRSSDRDPLRATHAAAQPRTRGPPTSLKRSG